MIVSSDGKRFIIIFLLSAVWILIVAISRNLSEFIAMFGFGVSIWYVADWFVKEYWS